MTIYAKKYIIFNQKDSQMFWRVSIGRSTSENGLSVAIFDAAKFKNIHGYNTRILPLRKISAGRQVGHCTKRHVN